MELSFLKDCRYMLDTTLQIYLNIVRRLGPLHLEFSRFHRIALDTLDLLRNN